MGSHNKLKSKILESRALSIWSRTVRPAVEELTTSNWTIIAYYVCHFKIQPSRAPAWYGRDTVWSSHQSTTIFSVSMCSWPWWEDTSCTVFYRKFFITSYLILSYLINTALYVSSLSLTFTTCYCNTKSKHNSDSTWLLVKSLILSKNCWNSLL